MCWQPSPPRCGILPLLLFSPFLHSCRPFFLSSFFTCMLHPLHDSAASGLPSVLPARRACPPCLPSLLAFLPCLPSCLPCFLPSFLSAVLAVLLHYYEVRDSYAALATGSSPSDLSLTSYAQVWMRGPAGRMGAYSAGMLIGWQFISFTKAPLIASTPLLRTKPLHLNTFILPSMQFGAPDIHTPSLPHRLISALCMRSL